MNTIKRMTIGEAKAYKSTEKELEILRTVVNTVFSDCPKQTEEELKLFERVNSTKVERIYAIISNNVCCHCSRI